MGLGLVVHLARPRRLAVAAHVEQIDVVAARRDVFHPGQAIELEVECRLGRIGRAMHEQQCALRPEPRHVGRPLVAHVDLDAGIGGRHHHLLGDELGRGRGGSGRDHVLPDDLRSLRESPGRKDARHRGEDHRSHRFLLCGSVLLGFDCLAAFLNGLANGRPYWVACRSPTPRGSTY